MSLRMLSFGNLTQKFLTSRTLFTRLYNQKIETAFSDIEKTKILETINGSDVDTLTKYNITKGRVRNLVKYKKDKGTLQSLSDIAFMEGFTEKLAVKFFRSVLDGGADVKDPTSRIRGQILYPALTDVIREKCEHILAVNLMVNSISWSCINKPNYELSEWGYHSFDVPEGKKLHITDIVDIVYKTVSKLPHADLYVMKAPATTLRAGGSDPNNPKVLTVNLQKAQITAMLVALLNARTNDMRSSDFEKINQTVYFLRPSLPFRLFGTLIGNEEVSSEYTIDKILSNSMSSENGSQISVSEDLKSYFKSQKEFERDILGQCLLLALTFMDVCVYRNKNVIAKLS